MNWLCGYGQSAPPPGEPPPVQAVRCPKCDSDQVRVRSGDRGTSYLECLDCGHGDGSTVWKVTIRLKRILVPFDG